MQKLNIKKTVGKPECFCKAESLFVNRKKNMEDIHKEESRIITRISQKHTVELTYELRNDREIKKFTDIDILT